LEQSEKPLHLTEIIKELEKYGRFTDRRILNGTIRKDHRKRFVNLGQNQWDLSSRHPKPSQE
jgi:DNA-directed RNA polymerase delta subunit